MPRTAALENNIVFINKINQCASPATAAKLKQEIAAIIFNISMRRFKNLMAIF
ncbi:MAG: hypothetical protein LBC07_06575 [Elusimicrobiota bacterium]|jgi:hypothetical protein|nr:hypothetical protein [Elusimicrobiota bacterium]